MYKKKAENSSLNTLWKYFWEKSLIKKPSHFSYQFISLLSTSGDKSGTKTTIFVCHFFSAVSGLILWYFPLINCEWIFRVIFGGILFDIRLGDLRHLTLGHFCYEFLWWIQSAFFLSSLSNYWKVSVFFFD